MFHRLMMTLCVLPLAVCAARPASATTTVADPYSGPQWYVTPLGLPNGTQFSVATGINSNGQVVGYFGNGVGTDTSPSDFLSNRNSDGTGGTFVWGAGTVSTLPTTINVSDTNVAINASAGFGISANGTVVGNVGYTDPTTQVPTGVATVYTGSQWQIIGPGTAQAISADGQTIVGGGTGGAFTYSGGTLTNLGGGQYASAYGMSSNGVWLAGGNINNLDGTGSGGIAPWLYNNGTFQYPDASYFSSDASGAITCVNSSGIAAGVVGSSATEIFKWNTNISPVNGAYSNLAWTVPSYSQYTPSGQSTYDMVGPYGITDSGDMVGTMDFGRHFGLGTWYEGYLGGGSVPFTGGNSWSANGFLYSANGNSNEGLSANTSYDLNNFIPQSDGWLLEGALGVATVAVPGHVGEEWIVGYGMYNGSLEGYLLTPTPLLHPGDANGDGRVDINDLTVVLANYNQTGETWSRGEFTGDGTVDINDLTIVLANYGQTFTTGAGLAAVPEPNALAMLGACLAGLLGCGWRKHR